MPQIEINPQFKKALQLFKNGKEHVFVTGSAGTGKSTLLNIMHKEAPNDTVLLAPTGIAAINIGGQTIHSFFGFKPDVDKVKAFKAAGKKMHEKVFDELKTIIIDEISMVRADLLDYVDIFLQRRLHNDQPFGGVRMVFFGDMFQLPPVITRDEAQDFKKLYESVYFTSANVVKRSDFQLKHVELSKIYRQSDKDFINLLQRVRKGAMTAEDLKILNTRLMSRDEYGENPERLEKYIYVTTTNKRAQYVNEAKLKQLETKLYISQAHVVGDFPERNMPTAKNLEFKIGARIMLLNNDQNKQWVNGSLGVITDVIEAPNDGHLGDMETPTDWEDDFDPLSYSTPYDEGVSNPFIQMLHKDPSNTGKWTAVVAVIVKLDSGKVVEVPRHTWDSYKYTYDPSIKAITAESAGSFTQFPFKLAWAITIHKSQGQTFDRVIIDFDRGTFAHGQAYVALSRCRSLEGILLTRPIRPRDIIVDTNL